MQGFKAHDYIHHYIVETGSRSRLLKARSGFVTPEAERAVSSPGYARTRQCTEDSANRRTHLTGDYSADASVNVRLSTAQPPFSSAPNLHPILKLGSQVKLNRPLTFFISSSNEQICSEF
jgi:hypothetical protein